MGLTKTQSGGLEDESVTLAKLLHGDGSSDGKFLRANNGADPTFETVSGTTINNNADNRVITGSGTANTLNGESGLTYDGSVLQVNGDGQFTGNDGTANQLKWDKSDDSLYFRDNVKSQFGTGGDLKIYHDGSKSHLKNSTGAIEYSSVDHKFFNAANNSEYARIDADGLKFNGDTAAANALDDYEEGTWTPAISGVTYTDAQGHYVKIGVTCFITLTLNGSNTSKTGDTRITGLPFTPKSGSGEYYPANSIPFFEVSSITLSSGFNNMYARIDYSQGNLQLLVTDGESHGILTVGSGTTLGSNHSMRTSFTYQTAS